MRHFSFSVAALLGTFALAACALTGCSGSAGDGSSTSDSAYTGDEGSTPQAACSLRYWDWVLHTLEPQLARSIDEVSDEQMTALVATHPPAEETKTSYAVCWTPIFDQFVYAPAAKALHDASVTFIDQRSPDFKSYDRYKANIAMTPELRRNAKALLALRPAKMQPSDVGTWLTAYDSIIAETIRPVGIPGLMMYEDVVEPEWVISAGEAEYLALMEKAGAAPVGDGVYGEWVRNFSKWVLGPPPAVTRSFVFNVPWEAAADNDWYGLSGLRVENGVPTFVPEAQSFVKRLAATQPASIGEQDSSAWMSIYNGRAIRALGDVSQNQPLVTQTDAMALDVLESVKPTVVRGAFTYETWLDLYVLAAGQSDDTFVKRIAKVEPCLDAPDLAAAQAKFTDKTANLSNASIQAPHVCAE